MLFLFMVVSIAIIIGVSLAVEWVVDWIFIRPSNKALFDHLGARPTRAEIRALHQAELNDSYNDLFWSQMVASKKIMVSPTLAKRGFQLLARGYGYPRRR